MWFLHQNIIDLLQIHSIPLSEGASQFLRMIIILLIIIVIVVIITIFITFVIILILAVINPFNQKQ